MRWTYTVIAGFVMVDLLRVIGGEPELPFASVVASPPAAVLFLHVRDDGVFAEAQFVFLLALVVVQRLHRHLSSPQCHFPSIQCVQFIMVMAQMIYCYSITLSMNWELKNRTNWLILTLRPKFGQMLNLKIKKIDIGRFYNKFRLDNAKNGQISTLKPKCGQMLHLKI